MSPTVLVCGAASAMGKAVVRRLAFAGYRVAAADECANSTGKIAEDNRKVGGDVQAFSVDISKPEHRTELIDRVCLELNGLDSLVIVPPPNKLRDDIMNASPRQFDQTFDAYVTTPFRLCKVAIPFLSKSQVGGSIVLMSSAAGYTPHIDGGLFSVVSTTVLSLTRTIAQNAAKHNVRVNCVSTGMAESDGSGAMWDAPSGQIEDGLRRNLQSMIPLGRLGRPSDAASLVEFLLSDRAKYITAENCLLNGGVSFRL